jgi:hypothetical protein
MMKKATSAINLSGEARLAAKKKAAEIVSTARFPTVDMV